MSEHWTLKPPIRVEARTSSTGTPWWLLEDAEGRRVSTWSREIADYLAAATQPVECEVDVRERDGRRFANVVAIPGVVERAKAGVGRRASSLLTDRQVALLVAALAHSGDILAAAEAYWAWLGGGRPPQVPSPPSGASPSHHTSPAGGGEGEAPPRPAAPPPADLDDALARAFPGRPALAQRWLDTELARLGVELIDLSPEQEAELVRRLEELAARRGSASDS